MLRDPIVCRIVWVLLSILCVVVCGTVGYALIEGWSLSDGLFMTTITASTVGYGETHTLSSSGRTFTSVLIILSVILMTCWNAALTSFLIDGDVSGRYSRRKTLSMISNLNEHTIVCGTGNMGRAVIERLLRKRIQVVVIGNDLTELEDIQKAHRKVFTLQGDATSELILAQANIMQANSIVVAMTNEVDNLLVGITCKDIGRDIVVYARSETPSIANRMRKAGIDNVICPPQICGDQVASMITA